MMRRQPWNLPGLTFAEEDGFVRIGGLQKTSLLDFPGKVSAVVFAQGCDFFCPYCHNPDLVPHRREAVALADVLAFLAQRRKVLEGVVVSGGEPTAQDNLFSFCATLKSLGYAVKLDTNGGRPEVLRQLLRAELLDYVAMDVKAAPEEYPAEICPQNAGKGVARSMALLEDSQVEHEFRIPCAAPFITRASFTAILDHIRHAQVFLQAIRLAGILREDFFPKHGHALDLDAMEDLRGMARQKGVLCRIR